MGGETEFGQFNSPHLILLLAFNGPRVLKARGGASYTFGALAILVEAPGRKPSRV